MSSVEVSESNSCSCSVILVFDNASYLCKEDLRSKDGYISHLESRSDHVSQCDSQRSAIVMGIWQNEELGRA